MLEADKAYLEERRRRGLDGRDEMWHRGGQPVAVSGDGAIRSDVLGVAFATVDGTLRLTWEGGEATVSAES